MKGHFHFFQIICVFCSFPMEPLVSNIFTICSFFTNFITNGAIVNEIVALCKKCLNDIGEKGKKC